MAVGGLGAYRNAIASIESGGNYQALGPVTRGDRPYGKYQVMGRNIPQWSKEVLGYEVTPEQFLANPQIQDAVFDGKFGGYVAKYGPIGAAQAWLGGPGSVGKTGRKDALGTSVGEYGKRFSQALGMPSTYQVGPGFKGKNPNTVAPPPTILTAGLGATPPEQADPAAAGREMLAGLGQSSAADEQLLAMAIAAMNDWQAGGQAQLPPPMKLKRTLAEAPKVATTVSAKITEPEVSSEIAQGLGGQIIRGKRKYYG